MRGRHSLFYFMIFLGLILGAAGCRKKEAAQIKSEEPVSIPVCFLVDPQTGKSSNEDLVNEFNKAYEGTYVLDVEWITDTAEGYRARMKMLNGLDKLPAILTDVGFDDEFYQLLLKNHRLVDLMPYMREDFDWLLSMDENTLAACQEPDGSMYMAPIGNSLFSYGGFYYNKELFKKAGIDKFPETWDGFFDCLEILKQKHITPLALHGGSSYWTALFIGTNYMARNEKGAAFLNTQYPNSYNNEMGRDLFSMIKRLYGYGDLDALKIEHADSAVRFQEGKNAIIANGGWMLLDFPKELREQLGFAPFPGRQLLNEPRMSAWAVAAGYSREVTDGAAAFLNFRFLQDQKATENFLNEKATVLEEEYKSAIKEAEKTTPNYQLKWEGEIQNNVLVNQLPLYIQGKISLAELLEAVDGEVLKIKEEQ